MNRRFPVLLYFACSIPLFSLPRTFAVVGTFGFMYYYILALIFLFFVFWNFLAKPDVDRMLFLLKFSCVLAAPYLLTIVIAPVLWAVNLSGFRNITRGLFMPLYEVIAVAMSAAVVYLFGKKGLFYQFWALGTAALLLMGRLMIQGGIGEFFYQYYRLLITLSEDTGDLMYAFETPCWAYGTGVYLIYFAVYFKKMGKGQRMAIPLCLLIFTMGLKRSALVGLALAAVTIVLLSRVPQKKIKAAALAVTGFFLLAGFCYVGAVYWNMYGWLSEALGINTMGRANAYEVLRQYYSFAPAFLGKGLGYSFYMISGGRIEGISGQFMGDIHNEYLRQYLELGMGGFLLWLWAFFISRTRAFAGLKSKSLTILVTASMAYCLGTFMTENIYYDFYFNLCLFTVILSAALGEEQSRREEGYGRG